MKTWRMNRVSRANGPRLSSRSRRALATTSSEGSSITFLATLTTFHRWSPYTACTGDSQGGQDSNLQPAVLETAALPIEPPPLARNLFRRRCRAASIGFRARKSLADFNYLFEC